LAAHSEECLNISAELAVDSEECLNNSAQEINHSAEFAAYSARETYLSAELPVDSGLRPDRREKDAANSAWRSRSEGFHAASRSHAVHRPGETAAKPGPPSGAGADRLSPQGGRK